MREYVPAVEQVAPTVPALHALRPAQGLGLGEFYTVYLGDRSNCRLRLNVSQGSESVFNVCVYICGLKIT